MPLTYIQWNDLIARYFFNEGMAGKEVILFANIDLINEIGRSYGEGFDNFVQKSIEGPESIYIRSDNICHKAYSTYLLGRRKRFAYPPYIGYLALFVCAATREGDYEINSYYPRLKDIVEDNTDTNMSACFTKIDQLWDDLQQWSQVEKGDMLGKFRKTRRGNLAHVGLIYAQTVMSEEERKKLPVIFSKANLDPTDPPSDESLRVTLGRYGQQILDKKTLKLLGENSELSNELVNYVLSELRDWDGVVEEVTSSGEGPLFQTAYARICLNEELGTFDSFLRFKINVGGGYFPEGEIRFKLINSHAIEGKQSDSVYSCREARQLGWSTPLYEISTMRNVRAEDFDWSEKYIFRDDEKLIQCIIRPTDVKVFFRGITERLPNSWVEVQHLDHECEFLVVCDMRSRFEIKSWGEECCEAFDEVRPSIGMAIGWSIFRGKNPRETNNRYPALTLPPKKGIEIKFTGGIRLYQAGNYYLDFAPPIISLVGIQGSGSVFLNGIKLEPEGRTVLNWRIPKCAEIGRPLTLEAEVDGEMLRQKATLWLVPPDMKKEFEYVPKADRFGEHIAEADNPKIFSRGVLVHGMNPSDMLPTPLGAPTFLSDTIVFIGPKAGQIVLWPNEDLPIDWHPVWALAKKGRKSWKVNFCGKINDIEEAPVLSDAIGSKRAIKRWREYIYVNRLRNEQPQNHRLKNLWKIYVEVAGNVR